MLRMPHLFVVFALLVSLSLPVAAQKKAVVQSNPSPTEFMTTPWVIGAEVAAQWTGLLPLVNAPSPRSRAYPGQRLTIAVAAKGKDRDQLLKNSAYTFTVAFGGASKAFNERRPTQIRQIKADGADFVKYVMEQSKVDAKGMDNALSMVSLALFDLDWQVPPDAKDGAVTLQGTVTTPDGKVTKLKDVSVEVWSAERVAKEGTFKDAKAGGEWTMTYYQHPEPFRLLHLLRLVKDDKGSAQPNVITLYAEILKSSPLAAQDLMRRLGREDRSTQIYALLLLSEAGYDLSACFPTLSAEVRDTYLKIRGQAAALPDPYDLSVNLSDPYQITTRMDMLWSRFLVTGDQKPVRAIAGVLEWREDGKAVLEIRRSGKKIDGITPGLLRGLAYGASGWSLGSFVRNHPLVADFVDAWKQDPKVPTVVKEELGTLITNDAFKGK